MRNELSGEPIHDAGVGKIAKLLYSKQDAAQALSVSVRTIDNLIARKELLVRKVGRRTLIPATTLNAFVRKDHQTQEPIQ